MGMNLQQTAGSVGQYFSNLPKAETPNYLISATASGFFATLTALSALEGGNVSYYFSLICAAAAAGVAANQYGLAKSYEKVSQSCNTLFTSAKQAFASKPVEAKEMTEAETNTAKPKSK